MGCHCVPREVVRVTELTCYAVESSPSTEYKQLWGLPPRPLGSVVIRNKPRLVPVMHTTMHSAVVLIPSSCTVPPL